MFLKLENYFKNESKHHFFRTLGLLLKNKLAKIIEIVLVFLLAFIIIKTFSSDEPSDLVYNQAVILWFANIIMLTIVFIGIKLRGEGLGLVLKK